MKSIALILFLLIGIVGNGQVKLTGSGSGKELTPDTIPLYKINNRAGLPPPQQRLPPSGFDTIAHFKSTITIAIDTTYIFNNGKILAARSAKDSGWKVYDAVAALEFQHQLLTLCRADSCIQCKYDRDFYYRLMIERDKKYSSLAEKWNATYNVLRWIDKEGNVTDRSKFKKAMKTYIKVVLNKPWY